MGISAGSPVGVALDAVVHFRIWGKYREMSSSCSMMVYPYLPARARCSATAMGSSDHPGVASAMASRGKTVLSSMSHL
eukprot:1706291-Alexandrium_andersonii.AAC.1